MPPKPAPKMPISMLMPNNATQVLRLLPKCPTVPYQCRYPSAKPKNAILKFLDSPDPTAVPRIKCQLLPTIYFCDAFQQSPIVDLNPFFLPFSCQSQPPHPLQEVN